MRHTFLTIVFFLLSFQAAKAEIYAFNSTYPVPHASYEDLKTLNFHYVAQPAKSPSTTCITEKETGSTYFDADADCLKICTSHGWQCVGAGAGGDILAAVVFFYSKPSLVSAPQELKYRIPSSNMFEYLVSAINTDSWYSTLSQELAYKPAETYVKTNATVYTETGVQPYIGKRIRIETRVPVYMWSHDPAQELSMKLRVVLNGATTTTYPLVSGLKDKNGTAYGSSTQTLGPCYGLTNIKANKWTYKKRLPSSSAFGLQTSGTYSNGEITRFGFYKFEAPSSYHYFIAEPMSVLQALNTPYDTYQFVDPPVYPGGFLVYYAGTYSSLPASLPSIPDLPLTYADYAKLKYIDNPIEQLSKETKPASYAAGDPSGLPYWGIGSFPIGTNPNSKGYIHPAGHTVINAVIAPTYESRVECATTHMVNAVTTTAPIPANAESMYLYILLDRTHKSVINKGYNYQLLISFID